MPFVNDGQGGDVWVNNPNDPEEMARAMGFESAAALNAQRARRIRAGDEHMSLGDTYFGSGPGIAAGGAAALVPGLTAAAGGGTFLSGYGAGGTAGAGAAAEGGAGAGASGGIADSVEGALAGGGSGAGAGAGGGLGGAGVGADVGGLGAGDAWSAGLPGEMERQAITSGFMPGMPTTLAAGVPLVAAKSIGDNLKSALLVAGATGALSAAAGSASPEEANAAAFADQARALEDERQARVQQGVQKVNDAFAGFDDSYFDNVRKSADDYYQPQIARQFTEAARQLPFRYATTNSSAYNRGRGFLEEDRARQEADYHAKSQEYADSQRTNIEGARGDLINQVNAGSGVEDAANIAATRAAAIARPPAFSPIADLFQKYTGDAANLALARSAGGASSNFGAPPILFNRGGGSVTYGR